MKFTIISFCRPGPLLKSEKPKLIGFYLTRSADFKIGCYDISRHGCIYCKRFHSSDTTFNLTVSMEQCDIQC